jgi:hypothetical protein
MKITKKRFVLIALFIFPLIFFLVLSTGIVNWTKLPVLTERIQDIPQVDSLQQISFKEKVNVLCFLGNDIDYAKTGVFNINQKIYKEFYGYLAFQAVAIYPNSQEEAVINLMKKLDQFTDMSKWIFIGMSDEEIGTLFASLKTNESLTNQYSNKAFIIDKDLKLRGRNDDKDTTDGLLFGYNMNSVGELNNKMEDDIKVLLYEYRAAFKNKKKADRKKIEL